ncbi:MAG: hypothetical protein QF701_13890 [Nitrospinota bacterium]|nr:hypothetical protein [Nitrospinota bacterium]MDP7168826.1 hypothetical protein [Nitrospinota bacterium]MDP7664679.1 hypothetical protein [Nitrospinota bacterium]
MEKRFWTSITLLITAALAAGCASRFERVGSARRRHCQNHQQAEKHRLSRGGPGDARKRRRGVGGE